MSVFKNVNVTKSIKMTSTTDTFNMPSVTTAQRDAIPDPEVGSLVFNNETENLEVYKSTGGIPTVTFDVLVVGGGGAGGSSTANSGGGGGGGAGGYIYLTGEVRQFDTYTVSVGTGAPVTHWESGLQAAQGENSHFDNLIAFGGGGGAGQTGPSSGGGSGGGGNGSYSRSLGTPNQGNDGANDPNGGGGGGAGSAGSGGSGGGGGVNTIDNPTYIYSKGGGATPAGRSGDNGFHYGEGGDGGGAGVAFNGYSGGSGANGVVIIRTAPDQNINFSNGLTLDITYTSGENVFRITSGDGTMEFINEGPTTVPSWHAII